MTHEHTSKKIPELLTVDEVSILFKVSKATVYRMVESRLFPFYKISGGLRFSMEDMTLYLESQRVKSRDEWFYLEKHKSRK